MFSRSSPRLLSTMTLTYSASRLTKTGLNSVNSTTCVVSAPSMRRSSVHLYALIDSITQSYRTTGIRITVPLRNSLDTLSPSHAAGGRDSELEVNTRAVTLGQNKRTQPCARGRYSASIACTRLPFALFDTAGTLRRSYADDATEPEGVNSELLRALSRLQAQVHKKCCVLKCVGEQLLHTSVLASPRSALNCWR
jgi:hypothetical protein